MNSGSQSAASSRPSMANCADGEYGSESGSIADLGDNENCDGEETGETGGRDYGAAITAIVESCREEHGGLARRAISAVPDERLRKEAVREIRGSNGDYKSRAVQGVLKSFLRWLVDQRDKQIVFSDPEGEEVSAPLEHSHSEQYVKEKYGVIKDAERGFVCEAEDPHSVMLTLSGSNKNQRGKPRCPGDHLVDLKESWKRFVRRELARVMDGLGFDRYDPENPPEKWWEYAVVVEPHKSGYAHFHVAVVASEDVEASAFEPVMEKHIEKCEMAGSDAHQILPENPSESAVSVNGIDPSKEYDPEAAMEDITNLGSYIAEYVGAAGEELWDRPVSEIICHSLLWATGARRVQFSQGWHELAGVGAEIRGKDVDGESVGWDLEGVREGDDGEIHDVHSGKVCQNCGVKVSGIGGDCPDCGGELISAGCDYMVSITGIPGGDPPAVRE